MLPQVSYRHSRYPNNFLEQTYDGKLDHFSNHCPNISSLEGRSLPVLLRMSHATTEKRQQALLLTRIFGPFCEPRLLFCNAWSATPGYSSKMRVRGRASCRTSILRLVWSARSVIIHLRPGGRFSARDKMLEGTNLHPLSKGENPKHSVTDCITVKFLYSLALSCLDAWRSAVVV
jgi:hypothetical protein